MRPRSMTVADLWALPRVGAPAPASDGSFAVVPVTTYDMEANEGTTRLWRVPGDSGHARPLTAREVSSSQPAVSPDGGWLAFVRKPAVPRGTAIGEPKYADKPQLYLMPLAGGEPERLTDLPLGVEAPRWFPDGRRLAFVVPLLPEALTVEGTAELAEKREQDPVKARITEDRVYRYWDHWLTDAPVHHIFVLDLETRALVDFTPASRLWFPFQETGDHYRIAPDGREIAFEACRSEPPHNPLLWGVYTVSVPAELHAGTAVDEPTLLAPDHPGHAGHPVYSPDGRWLVYGIQREIDFYADKMRLVAYDRQRRAGTVLTEAWDRSAADWTFGDDANRLYLIAEEAARNVIFTLDLAAALAAPDDSPPQRLAGGEGWFSQLRLGGQRLFATWQSLSRPPEVHALDHDGTGRRPITDFTGDQLSELTMGRVEDISFPGAGGAAVQMFLVYPPDPTDPPDGAPTDASREPYPLVHLVHGGPHGTFGDQWHWRWNAQLVAAAGYLVAMVNFHGSTGWGQAFTASILGRWGDQPYHDLMAATDTLIERGLADPARLAVSGGSYGGYLVTWVVSQTDRFACAINHAGVSDFQTQYASDITQGRRRSMGGELWGDLAGLDRYNPLRHARGFKTPMLVIHGEQDHRVPYTQGLAVYNVYKAMGLPARLVCYPDENHWILKPKNSRLWYEEFLGWLARWLAGGLGGAPSDR